MTTRTRSKKPIRIGTDGTGIIPRPIGAEETVDAARLHRQVQAVHGGDGPVALGQTLYFDGVHFCASFSLNRANTPRYTSVSDALISSVSQSRKDVAAMEAMPWT